MTAINEGLTFKIESYKHDGSLNRKWLENIILHQTDNELIGVNNETVVVEANDKQWKTEEPALFYFHKHHWFNVVYILDEKNPYYYCNISSPYTYRDNVLTYTDYDLDIIVNDDFSYTILDEEEYELNKKSMDYGAYVEQNINEQINIVKRWIKDRNAPFNRQFINSWWQKATKYYVNM